MTKQLEDKKHRGLYRFQIFCALAGMGLSLFLLVQHTLLKSGIQASASICSIGTFVDCDAVHASEYSEMLGFATAAWGALYFFVLFLLGVLARPSEASFRYLQKWAARLAGLSLLGDIGLLLISIFELNAICLFCIATYCATIGHFTANSLMAEKHRSGFRGFFTNALFPRHVPSLQVSSPRLVLAATGLLSFIAVLVFLPSVIWIQSNFYSYGKRLTEQFYRQWQDRPAAEIPIAPTDGTYGNPNAKVKIVVFSDFECPHCRKSAFTLHALLKPLRNRVHFIFKHYPLDSSCNPLVSYQLHPMACRFAQLSFCAQQKGKFWEFHNLLFLDLPKEGKLPSWDRILSKLKPVLSRAEIAECFQNEQAAVQIAQDIALAKQLRVEGTPTVFINGKMVGIPITVETIQTLIQMEEN